MNSARGGLRRWLAARHAGWHLVAEWVESDRDRNGQSTARAASVVRAYAALIGDVGLARSVLGPDADLTVRLETLLVRATSLLYREPQRWRESLAELLGRRVRHDMQALPGRLAAVVTIFFIAALAGAGLVWRYPELAGLVASEAMIDSVERGVLWTDGLLAVVPPAFVAFGIMTNNIVVALFAFTLGTFYGIGTLYILAVNGFMLGGAFAFTARYGLADDLFRFVVAHGPVELSVIWIASAAGINLGEALARPGNRSRSHAFRQAVQASAGVLAVCLPFLIGAGVIEGFISPDDGYPLANRAVIGCCYEVLLIITLSGAWFRRTPY